MFERGREAYDRGDYRSAWSLFHDAYRLSGRAPLLYNIGQATDRLGHDAEALAAFKLYLERVPNAANRREVENRVRALEERVKRAEHAAPPAGSAGVALSGSQGSASPETLADEPNTQQPAPEPASATPAAPPAAESRPTRRGWYFRLGLGLGLRGVGLSGASEGSVRGAGFAGELAVAATLLPGFVLGGAIYSDLASSPTYELNGDEAKLGSINVTMFGAAADWYVQPTKNGLHFQAALCLAVMNIDYDDTSVAVGRSPAGVGAVLGVGYEWPIADEVGLGVLGRISVATLAEETRSHGFFAPSVLASLSWY